jgi:hypothetical protein
VPEVLGAVRAGGEVGARPAQRGELARSACRAKRLLKGRFCGRDPRCRNGPHILARPESDLLECTALERRRLRAQANVGPPPLAVPQRWPCTQAQACLDVPAHPPLGLYRGPKRRRGHVCVLPRPPPHRSDAASRPTTSGALTRAVRTARYPSESTEGLFRRACSYLSSGIYESVRSVQPGRSPIRNGEFENPGRTTRPRGHLGSLPASSARRCSIRAKGLHLRMW